jgi:large subunit ribosomal protein L10
MRPEKQYLVDEVGSYLDRTDYVYLADFAGLTVEQTNELRELLDAEGAEFHVVKNSIFNVAAKERDFPDLSEYLGGQTAIVIGGPNAPGVAKKLIKFHKDKDKVAVKGGVLGKSAFAGDQLQAVADTPPIEVLQAQLLGLMSQPATQLVRLLNTPATQFVTVIGAVPRDLLSVLKQKELKDSAA